jgi:hypothetical protein
MGHSLRNKNILIVAPRITASNAKATPLLSPNTASTISCRITNRGSIPADSITLTLVNPFGFVSQSPDPVTIDLLQAGESRTVSFHLGLNSDVPQTRIPFYLYATTQHGTYLVDTLHLACGPNNTEDYESGDFSRFSWTFNNRAWEIDSSNAFDGNYCARSQVGMSHGRESRISISWDSPNDDSISFYYKVSSEEGYDMFHFTIDGTDCLTASGQKDWVRASFPITAGSHIYSFRYTKDYNGSSGNDCAWIDNITLPFPGTFCKFDIDQVCVGTPYDYADTTLPTSQVGTYAYSDTTHTPWQYLALTVLDAPQVEIQVIRNTSDSRCLLLKAVGADHYIWNTGDSTDCIAVCPDTTATYTVTGYRAGCSAEASTTLLSIAQPTADTHVTLHPNPAHTQVTISAEHIRTITLVNIMGQVLSHQPVNANTSTLNIQNLPNGIYFIQIETPNSTVTKKLVKK